MPSLPHCCHFGATWRIVAIFPFSVKDNRVGFLSLGVSIICGCFLPVFGIQHLNASTPIDQRKNLLLIHVPDSILGRYDGLVVRDEADLVLCQSVAIGIQNGHCELAKSLVARLVRLQFHLEQLTVLIQGMRKCITLFTPNRTPSSGSNDLSRILSFASCKASNFSPMPIRAK